jgi:hypothetical protein
VASLEFTSKIAQAMGRDLTTHSSRLSRRQAVHYGGAFVATLLAGCSGLITSTGEQQAVKSVSFNKGRLIINLNSDTDAEAIEFYTPNDELLQTVSVGRKQQVSVSLFTEPTNPLGVKKPLPAGDYGLIATKSGSGNNEPKTISDQTVELTSSFSITGVSVLEGNAPSDFTQDAPSYAENLKVTVKNTGNLPLGVKYVGVTDGVPSPTPPPQEVLQGGMRTSAFELAAHHSTGPYYIDSNSTLAFKTTTGPLSYYSPWQNPEGGDSPRPHTWGAPKNGASWETIQANYCQGNQHPATIVVAPMNLEPQRATATLRWGGMATRRQRLDTDYACTNVAVTDISNQNTSK